MKKKPNILYLHSHDTGISIHPYGFSVCTFDLHPQTRDQIYQYVLEDLCNKLHEGMILTDAPLIKGKVPASKGEKLNCFDQTPPYAERYIMN